MGAGKSVLLVFLSVILVLSLFILGIFWSIHALLYPQVYENVLADNGVYSLVNLSQIPGGSLISFPAGGVEALVNGLLENSLSYLRGDSKSLNLTVEVNSSEVNSIFLQGIESLPICRNESSLVSGEIPSCRPADINNTEFLNKVLEKNNLTGIGSQQVNLALVFGIKQKDLAGVRSYIKSYEYSLYGLIILALALSVLMFFISPSRTRWQGISFLISGIIVLVFGNALLSFALQSIPSGIPQAALISSVSKEIAGALSARIKGYSLTIGIIGIIAFAASFFIKKKNQGVESGQEQNKPSKPIAPQTNMIMAS